MRMIISRWMRDGWISKTDRHHWSKRQELSGDSPLTGTVAATAENGEDGPYYLAVLIAYQLTAKSQVGVDYRGKNTVKSVQNEKYSAKSADSLRFLLYLCHVIDDYACLDLQH